MLRFKTRQIPYPALGALLAATLVLAACGKDAADVPAPEEMHTPCCRPRPRTQADPSAHRPRATLAAKLAQPPMPLREQTHPQLGFRSHGSIAVGDVTDGYLVDDAILPLEGEYHRVLPEQAGRRTNRGTNELVHLILLAAERVAKEKPGARLGVGNLARPGGGRLPWSRSHNNGLDADLAFYLVDDEGAPCVVESLLHVQPDGRVQEKPSCLLDVARTWLLVAALLDDDEASVQWIFVADHIKQALLAYGRLHRAGRRTLARAVAVLHQPRGALPHDDHMHIRLFCPAEDRLEGCRDRGTERDWMPRIGDALARRTRKLVNMLGSRDATQRAGALRLLALLRANDEGRHVAALLRDRDPDVRAAALEAVRDLRVATAVPRLAQLLDDTDDKRTRARILEVLERMRVPAATNVLIDHLHDRRLTSHPGAFRDFPSTVQRDAVRLLARIAPVRSVPALVDALAERDPVFREKARETLRLVTNHAFLDASGATLQGAWQDWWRRRRSRGSNRLLAEGFRSAGYPVDRIDRNALPGLLSAVLDERDWVSQNARRALGRLAGSDPGSRRWSRDDAYSYWRRWCRRRHGARRCD